VVSRGRAGASRGALLHLARLHLARLHLARCAPRRGPPNLCMRPCGFTCAHTNAHARAHAHAHAYTNTVLAVSAAHMRSRPPTHTAAQEPTAQRDGRSPPAEQQQLRLRRRTPPRGGGGGACACADSTRRWRRRALGLPWCSGAWPPVAFSAGGRRALQTCGAVGTAERRHGRPWFGWWAAHTAGDSQGGRVPDESNPASLANAAAPAAPAFRLEPAAKQTHAAASRAAGVATAARRAAHRAAHRTVHRPRRRRRRRAATARRRRATTARAQLQG
jgi:hypothetical protein